MRTFEVATLVRSQWAPFAGARLGRCRIGICRGNASRVASPQCLSISLIECFRRRRAGNLLPPGPFLARALTHEGTFMRRIFALAFGIAVALGASSSVDARGGCGRGWHPGPNGHRCFRNAGPAVVVAPRPGVVVVTPVVGVYVSGHGYWDGHRYWGHRDRFHGGWRYR